MGSDKEMMPTKSSKSNPLINMVRAEWRHLGRRKGIFILYVSLFVLAGLVSLANPLVIGAIFNSIQNEVTTDAELWSLIRLISLLFFLQVGFWLLHGTGRVLEGRTGFFVGRNFTNTKLHQVLELPMKWHKDHHSGDTIDKVNKGSSAIAGFSQYTTFEIVYGLVNLFGAIIILFFFDVRAALFGCGFSVAVLLMVMRFDKTLGKQQRKLNRYSNKVAAAVYDYISNITTVITLRLKRVVRREVDERLMASHKTYKKFTIVNELKWGLASISIALMTVLVLALRAHDDFVTNGVIMVGTIYILYGYLEKVGNSFYRFASLYSKIVAYDANVANSEPIDEAYSAVTQSSKGKLPADWKHIELENVSFTHTSAEHKMHLDDISFNFKRGERIAFIGESGSGKSTVLALLRGLNEPESGTVIVDKIQLNDGFSRLKHAITLIPQDPEIFNETIKYNVTLGLPSKKEDLEKALRMAQFTKVIDRLEKGLDSNVMEKGVSLSGGEKQRLALARGILAAKRSDIVLMDEPTSSVDPVNEAKIYENIFKVFRKKTIISSVHRLHLLSKFDRIVLFDDGKIVCDGTLATLRKNKLFMELLRKSRAVKEQS